jgi:hypothetical protein
LVRIIGFAITFSRHLNVILQLSSFRVNYRNYRKKREEKRRRTTTTTSSERRERVERKKTKEGETKKEREVKIEN